MKTDMFFTKSKTLMYKCQSIGWTNILQFILDLWDIIMWLIQ